MINNRKILKPLFLLLFRILQKIYLIFKGFALTKIDKNLYYLKVSSKLIFPLIIKS